MTNEPWPPESDPTNPAASPVLDGWGWGEYWSASEWLTWHAAMKSTIGLAAANARFLAAWNEQGIGANPLNARTFSPSFREYARANGFMEGLYDNASGFSVILNPAGSVIELAGAAADGGGKVATGVKQATDAAAESVGQAASALKTIGPALVLVGVLALGWLYFQKLKPRSA